MFGCLYTCWETFFMLYMTYETCNSTILSPFSHWQFGAWIFGWKCNCNYHCVACWCCLMLSMPLCAPSFSLCLYWYIMFVTSLTLSLLWTIELMASLSFGPSWRKRVIGKKCRAIEKGLAKELFCIDYWTFCCCDPVQVIMKKQACLKWPHFEIQCPRSSNSNFSIVYAVTVNI